MKHRLVIFSNSVFGVPGILIKRTLSVVTSLNNIELVAVVLHQRPNFQGLLRYYFQQHIRRTVQSAFDWNIRYTQRIPFPIPLERWARQFNFKILFPVEGNINHPRFLQLLREEVQPTIALSYHCLQKFSPALLEIFAQAVNYHNGLLPQYKGLGATQWSLYHQEVETGFTFHYMTENFDEGSILFQAAVPIPSQSHAYDLNFLKARKAADQLPHVFRMVCEKNPGQPQVGTGAYFSRKDQERITTIRDPSSISSSDYVKRFKAFQSLEIYLEDQWYLITKVKILGKTEHKPTRLSFQTSDGIMMRPTRIHYLPYSLFRMVQWAKKVSGPFSRKHDKA